MVDMTHALCSESQELVYKSHDTLVLSCPFYSLKDSVHILKNCMKKLSFLLFFMQKSCAEWNDVRVSHF